MRWAFPFLLLLLGACSSGKIADGSTDGAAIYNEACARCHGAKGIPSRGMASRTGVKPLTSVRVAKTLSDEELRRQILKGSKNRMMPRFEGALSDAQVEALIPHLRRLANPPAPPAQP